MMKARTLLVLIALVAVLLGQNAPTFSTATRLTGPPRSGSILTVLRRAALKKVCTHTLICLLAGDHVYALAINLRLWKCKFY